ncbi:MAG: hypothetical protein OK457_01770 [Thaumarchaeota archaeon]|nr:hypothetical protein [Nitrososphaerota archaeon]
MYTIDLVDSNFLASITVNIRKNETPESRNNIDSRGEVKTKAIQTITAIHATTFCFLSKTKIWSVIKLEKMIGTVLGESPNEMKGADNIGTSGG